VLVTGETITLGPFARFAEPGHLFNYSKSAIRALEVLELFRASSRQLKAREIARALEISPSSADQLLKTLVDGAYLHFDPTTKLYWPTPRTAALAGGLGSALGTDTLLERFIEGARNVLGRNVNIAIAQGAAMQIILGRHKNPDIEWPTRPDQRRGTLISIGTRVPLFGSSSGAAWMSVQPRDVILSCIAQCRRELGALADAPEQLIATLEKVREQGYALGGISKRNNAWGISMPFPPTEQGLIHIVSVSDAQADLARDRDRIVDYLRTKIADLRG
jgi:DNA-binding IclR family transcriptional regulator